MELKKFLSFHNPPLPENKKREKKRSIVAKGHKFQTRLCIFIPSEMEGLEKWFKDNGGYLHPSVQLSHDEVHGSHFRASSALEPGTHILTVPHHLAISNLNAQVDDAFPVFRTHAKSFTVEALTFFYLMAQWVNKESSFWKPYLDTLPTPEEGYGTPLWFDEEDRKWIEGTDLQPTSLAREAVWRKYWEEGIEVMQSAGMDVRPYTW